MPEVAGSIPASGTAFCFLIARRRSSHSTAHSPMTTTPGKTDEHDSSAKENGKCLSRSRADGRPGSTRPPVLVLRRPGARGATPPPALELASEWCAEPRSAKRRARARLATDWNLFTPCRGASRPNAARCSHTRSHTALTRRHVLVATGVRPTMLRCYHDAAHRHYKHALQTPSPVEHLNACIPEP